MGTNLDQFVYMIKKDRDTASIALKPAAIALEKLDKRINRKKLEVKELEKQKQELLSDFRDLMETAIITSFTLHDDYKITTDNRRKITITDYAPLLKWLKANKTPEEIVQFFTQCLAVSKVSKYMSKEVNNAREAGKLTLNIDGIKIGDIVFGRLKTRSKENDRIESLDE